MSTQEITSTNNLQAYSTRYEQGQYTLWQILGIWALVALPMALLAWVVAPAIITYSPLHPGITYWLLMITGMAWQFVLSLVILYRELGTLRWSAIRQRTWLQTPRDPGTDQPNPRLFWWLLPVLLFQVLVSFVIGYLDAPMAWLFPALQPAPYQDIKQLASPEFQGQWWILGVALVSFIFNYFLGEEFLFRGVLLPKMGGVFGKYDWVANAVLFGSYHLHMPWTLPGNILVSNLAIVWPARRFRSIWMAIIVHGVEGLFVLGMVLAVILGLVG